MGECVWGEALFPIQALVSREGLALSGGLEGEPWKMNNSQKFREDRAVKNRGLLWEVVGIPSLGGWGVQAKFGGTALWWCCEKGLYQCGVVKHFLLRAR